jgi:hypothetical protein
MLLCASAGAADFHSLDVKTGEWETSMTGQMTGMPQIPEEALKQMTPEQRAKIEAAMGARGAKPIISKSCMTKDKLDQAFNVNNEALKACTRTLTTSSSTKQEIRLECNRDGMKTSGAVKIEAIDSEHIKGSMQMTATSTKEGGHTMNMNYSFLGKWIGATCTEK